MKELGLNVMWIEKCIYMENASVEPHAHTFYHYLYVINGSGSIMVDNKTMALEKDTIYMIKPNTLHQFRAGEAGFLELYEIKFSVDDGGLADRLEKAPVKLHFDNAAVKDLLKAMYNESVEKVIYYTEMINAKFYEALTLILRLTQRKNNAAGKINENEDLYGIKTEFRKVISYIRKNFGKQVALNDLAEIMCVEKTHFVKKFKKEFAITPMKYLNKVRIDKAKELLEYADMNITQISSVVGFASIHYFSRTFSKFTGMTPCDYRNEALTKKNYQK